MFQSDSRKIIKNTLFLYIRMGANLIISLFSTRITLDLLNIDNYGLIKAISSVALLFGFLYSTFSYTTQRFLSISLATNDQKKTNDIFNASIICFGCIGLLILALDETIGLWIINHKMSFPTEERHLANFVFQLTILSSLINIAREPLNAIIISHEKFSFFTYTTIIDSTIRLFALYLLTVMPNNVCYTYLSIQCIVNLITLCWYIIYCKKNFSQISIGRIADISIFKEMLGFSNWSIFGSIANTSVSRGTVILINHFFGVTINASYALADRIGSFIEQFVSSFNKAFTPQLTKVHAANDYSSQEKMISLTTRISFFIIMIIGIPMFFNIDFLLKIWLGNVPAHTGTLCKLLIVAIMIKIVSGPLWVTILATGKIKKYQIINSFILSQNFIITLILFITKHPIESCLYARMAISILLFINRLWFIKQLTQISVKAYLKDVLSKLIIISIITSASILLLDGILSGPCKLFITTPILLSIIIIAIYSCGTNSTEKAYIKEYLQHTYKSRRQK